MKCLQCGGSVPPKDPKKHGRQPEFCSVECKKVHRKAYFKKWSAKNVSWIREYKASNREQVRAWDKAFYERHRERRKKLRVEYYKANTEKTLAAARKYAAEHPELIRKLGRKCMLQRRARLKGAFVEVVDPAKVFERDHGICGICKLPVDSNQFDVDHVIPLSKGGAHEYANVQLAHAR